MGGPGLGGEGGRTSDVGGGYFDTTPSVRSSVVEALTGHLRSMYY